MLIFCIELGQEKQWIKSEFVDKYYCFGEVSCEVFPEVDFANLVDMKGLIFSIY